MGPHSTLINVSNRPAMLSLCVLFTLLANSTPFPLLLTSAENGTIFEKMETYRRILVNMPDEIFDLESFLGVFVDDPKLEAKMEKFRKKVAKLPGEFFEIELEVNRKFGMSEERRNETAEGKEESRGRNEDCGIWHLGMNLNPSDGHTMLYNTGWHTGETIGTPETALSRDFLDSAVWREPADYIAIARHQNGILDAVKVFRFINWGIPLLDRFQMMDPGRLIVTEGGPIQESIAEDALNLGDDPIFSVGGDLAFNWVYHDNGHRVLLTGGNLPTATDTAQNTYGLANDFAYRNYRR